MKYDMKKLVVGFFRYFFNWFFVKQCPVCFVEQESENVCNKCYLNISFLGACCIKCQEPFDYQIPDVKVCDACSVKDLDFYSNMICAVKYNETMKNLVLRFKNQQDFNLANLFGKWISNRCDKLGNCYHDSSNLIIIPVPLFKKRLIKRGYNQSMILARALSNILNAPVMNVLERVRDTNSQATKTIQERAENVQGAFAVRKKYQTMFANGTFSHNKFLIIDDVITTGATLFECAKALKKTANDTVIEIDLIAMARRLKRSKITQVDLSNELYS